MSERIRQVLPHAVMLAAAVLLYASAAGIEADTGGRIGPAFWPNVIIVALGLLCLYEIVKRLVAGAAPSAQGLVEGLQEAPSAAESASAPAAPREHPRKLFAAIGLIAAYVFAVSWLGFFATTVIFLAAFAWIGGYRRPVFAATLGLAGGLALVVIFMRVAYISLPLGEGPFRSLSLALLRAIGVS